MDLMQGHVWHCHRYPTLALTLLANIETATKSDYGRKF